MGGPGWQSPAPKRGAVLGWEGGGSGVSTVSSVAYHKDVVVNGLWHPNNAADHLVLLTLGLDCGGTRIPAIATHYEHHVNPPHVNPLHYLPAQSKHPT